MKNQTREEKIEGLKNFLAGKVPLAEIVPERWFNWYYQTFDPTEKYSNTIDGMHHSFTRDELDQWLKTRIGRKEKHFIIYLQEGNDPLPDDDDALVKTQIKNN